MLLDAGSDANDGAGAGRFRSVRADSRGRNEQLEDHVDYSRGGRRVRAARDGHAQSEGGRRLGGEDHGFVGTGEHASRAVDLSAAQRSNTGTRLGKYGIARRGGRAVSWTTHGEAAGVDAEHEGSRDGTSGVARSGGASAAERRGLQLFRGHATAAGTEVGRASHAGQRETSGSQAANTGGA